MNSLLTKIRNHEANVAIIGLGYVGLPLALRFAEEKFNVFGFDIDNEKIESLLKRNLILNIFHQKKLNLL